MVKGMLKSSSREEIQRYYRGKFLSMVGSKGMSLNEQSDTPGENLAPVRPESSVETQSSLTEGRTREGDSSSTGGPALVLIQVQS